MAPAGGTQWQNRPQMQNPTQPQPAPVAPPLPQGSLPPIGNPNKREVEEESARSFNLMTQLMSQLQAMDAFQNNLAARRDPTIPALLNSQLGTFANFQNAGGVNPNAILGGDFSGTNFQQPMTMGAGNGSPFDIPIQRPGGNATTEALFNQLIQPVAVDQLANIAQALFTFGNPSPELFDQYSANRPVPDVAAPDFNSIFDQLGIPAPVGFPGPQAQQQPQAQQPQQQPSMVEPVSSIPLASFQMGTPFVPQTGNYQLHQGEAVVPANQNPMNQQRPAAQMGPTGGFIPVQPPPQNMTMPGTTVPGTQPRPLPPEAPPIMAQPQPTPYAAGQWGGSANPLQQALMSMSQQLQSGGPINQNVQNIQNQQVADMVSRAQQQQTMDLRSRMGARGLGGSGLQFGMEGNINDAALRALVEGQNQVGLGAANTNFNALQNAAQNLFGGALGAGQFGLQQAQFNMGQSQSMFEQLMDSIRKSFVNPSQAAENTTTVAFA